MLVVQLFDELEKIVVDLRLIAFSYLFLLFSVDMHLCFEHSLAVWRAMLWWASAERRGASAGATSASAPTSSAVAAYRARNLRQLGR